MAKRPAARRGQRKRSVVRRAGSRRSGKRPSKTSARRSVKRAAAPKRAARARRAKTAAAKPAAAAHARTPTNGPAKRPRLDRVRRTLDDTVPTPPSSLDMDRRASAARTGRAEMAEALQKHPGVTPAITGGDVDASWEQAYFAGDEAPGGDNPTPDQEVVDDIGKALGVQYQDNEELKSTDKVVERDKHRWELDPASAEDYKERK